MRTSSYTFISTDSDAGINDIELDIVLIFGFYGRLILIFG